LNFEYNLFDLNNEQYKEETGYYYSLEGEEE